MLDETKSGTEPLYSAGKMSGLPLHNAFNPPRCFERAETGPAFDL
jgi:hypothetical protein